MEETLVCPETGTDSVLQISGETPPTSRTVITRTPPHTQNCMGGAGRGAVWPEGKRQSLTGRDGQLDWRLEALSHTGDHEVVTCSHNEIRHVILKAALGQLACNSFFL